MSSQASSKCRLSIQPSRVALMFFPVFVEHAVVGAFCVKVMMRGLAFGIHALEQQVGRNLLARMVAGSNSLLGMGPMMP